MMELFKNGKIVVITLKCRQISYNVLSCDESFWVIFTNYDKK